MRVAAAGLNPMDWLFASVPEIAAQFGLTLPSGFAAGDRLIATARARRRSRRTLSGSPTPSSPAS